MIYKSSHNLLVLSLALSHGLFQSHHIVISVINSLPKSELTENQIIHFISEMYPALPKITSEHWRNAEILLDLHKKNNIECISILDERYPLSLRVIKNPPSILYVKGDLSLLTQLPGVAVVGTRQITQNGSIIAKRLSAFLAENDWVIVSGLAIGVDTFAHQGALSVNGKTIAVLASGLHKASPKQNSLLADEIILKGGAWVSEHPWGVEPRKEFFVPRNRIQIGLSAGSIIVESEIKSGTATQAEFCLNENRPLFAVVPHHPNNPLFLLSNGPLHLVENKGAIPVMTRDDYPNVMNQLNISKSKLLT